MSNNLVIEIEFYFFFLPVPNLLSMGKVAGLIPDENYLHMTLLFIQKSLITELQKH